MFEFYYISLKQSIIYYSQQLKALKGTAICTVKIKAYCYAVLDSCSEVLIRDLQRSILLNGFKLTEM